ncbi:MAG: hypothetical protein LBM04_09560 [Opitutaceae bacterium]|nr:hypothetical protein [Opitutaceae bacterium]
MRSEHMHHASRLTPRASHAPRFFALPNRSGTDLPPADGETAGSAWRGLPACMAARSHLPANAGWKSAMQKTYAFATVL